MQCFPSGQRCKERLLYARLWSFSWETSQRTLETLDRQDNQETQDGQETNRREKN